MLGQFEGAGLSIRAVAPRPPRLIHTPRTARRPNVPVLDVRKIYGCQTPATARRPERPPTVPGESGRQGAFMAASPVSPKAEATGSRPQAPPVSRRGNRRTDHGVPTSGYSGHIPGSKYTRGHTFNHTLRQAEVMGDDSAGAGLPELLQPTALLPARRFYGRFEHGNLFKGCLRNRSDISVGDDRDSNFGTTMLEQFKNPRPPRGSKPKSCEEVRAQYAEAVEQNPDWKVQRMERSLQDKTNQRIRGGTFMMRRAFKFFDRDGSGGIDATELRNGLALFGLQFEEHEVLALMARYDPDCSGEIDYYEFLNHVMDDSWYEKNKEQIKNQLVKLCKDPTQQHKAKMGNMLCALAGRTDKQPLRPEVASNPTNPTSRNTSRNVTTPLERTRRLLAADQAKRQKQARDDELVFALSRGIPNLQVLEVQRQKLSTRYQFDKLDINRDGVLSLAEFGEFAKQLGVKLSKRELAYGFSQLDKDSNNKLSFGEFERWYQDLHA